jgi:hypothetical protein
MSATEKFTLTIKQPPRRGEGLNDWLRDRAIEAAHAGATAESVAKALADLVGREANRGEIKRQVERGFRWARGGSVAVEAGERRRRWPERDDAALLELLAERRSSVAELRAQSPHPAPEHPLDVLRELHRPAAGSWLCLNQTPIGHAQTRTFEDWEKRRTAIADWAMCVPNLMRARSAFNKDGDPSQRCRDNACGMGAQRFVVIELDIRPDSLACLESGMTPPDICASVIDRLDRKALRMVVHSGGKSLHAWFECKGATQAAIETTFRRLCVVGADYRAVFPEQQFRLPQGWRAEKGIRQEVIFFNPQPQTATTTSWQTSPE